MTINKTRIAIFISGRGSNMDAILDACEAQDYPAEPVLVLANKPDAKGLDAARARGIAAVAVDHKAYDSRESFEKAIQAELSKANVEFIALAGFMRVLTEWFISRWEGRMINIHPSLLPSFPGLHTHRRAIDAGCRLTGCSVHYVTAGVDEGPIIGQAVVPIFKGDDEDTLAARVLKTEHKLYPACLRAVLENQDRAGCVSVNEDEANSFIISTP